MEEEKNKKKTQQQQKKNCLKEEGGSSIYQSELLRPVLSGSPAIPRKQFEAISSHFK